MDTISLVKAPAGSPAKVWEEYEPNILLEKGEPNFSKSKKIWETNDVREVIIYTNTQGQSFRNTIQDILFHITKHSTYHRKH